MQEQEDLTARIYAARRELDRLQEQQTHLHAYIASLEHQLTRLPGGRPRTAMPQPVRQAKGTPRLHTQPRASCRDCGKPTSHRITTSNLTTVCCPQCHSLRVAAALIEDTMMAIEQGT